MLFVLGTEDVHALQALRELFNVDETVIIFVESLHQVDGVFLQVREALSALLDLLNNVVNRCFWEDVGVVLHVLLSVLVGLQEHELETGQEDGGAENEILLRVVLASSWVSLLLSLHETAANSSGVLIANLVDLDSIITTVEGDDEFPGLIIWLSGHQARFESEDMHILLEHLLHVDLWWFSIEGEDGTKRVLRGSVAIVSWDSLVSHVWSSFSQLEWLLVDAHVGIVPVLGEIITVIDEAFSAVDDDLVAANEIGWSVELLVLQRHAWAVSQDWGLGQLLLFEEHWEWETPGILSVDLLHLNSSVGQEVVEDVVLITTIVGLVLPEDVEAKHLSVVVEERLEVLVGSSTLEKHLDVVLHLGLIWRSLLVVDHGPGLGEEVLGVALWSVELDALVGEETLGEVVTVDHSEDPLVDVEVDANVQVLPSVVLGVIIWIWQLVSLQEDALGDTSVLNSWLDDVDGVIVQVVVDDALAESEVLVGVLNDWLLEVCVEAKNL